MDLNNIRKEVKISQEQNKLTHNLAEEAYNIFKQSISKDPCPHFVKEEAISKSIEKLLLNIHKINYETGYPKSYIALIAKNTLKDLKKKKATAMKNMDNINDKFYAPHYEDNCIKERIDLKHSKFDVRKKVRDVCLSMLDDGKTAYSIAKQLDLPCQTVYNWKQRYFEGYYS